MALRFLSLTIGLFLATAGASVRADAELDLRLSIQRAVVEAWDRSDYSALDRMAESYASTRERTFSGKWRLTLYDQALSSQLQVQWPREYRLFDPTITCECTAPDPHYYDRAEERWATVDQKTQNWLRAYPGSPHAIVARARYFSNRGWFYRGTTYAKDVPAEGWAQMRRYEAVAKDFLESHRDARIRNPVWFQEMLELATDLSLPDGAFRELADDFKKNGNFYPAALQLVFDRLQPKWYGSPKLMDRFAREVTELTRADDGSAMYARLYWNIARDYPRTLFTEAGADWPTMRAGFEDMVKQYPDARNLNGFGTFACMAGDFDTMDKVLRDLGDRLLPALWGYYAPYSECISRRDEARRRSSGPRA
jgi:hypothetical protein